MRYLLVNHVPFGRGSRPGRFLVGSMWLTDLRAQRRALADIGADLVVATPLFDPLPPGQSGSFDEVEIDLTDEGFEYLPLPPFLSMRQFIARRGETIRRLRAGVQPADVVQADYGGHPVPLGRLVWPLAAASGARRIWVFDGADPMPRMELHANDERNAVRRFLKWRLVRRTDAFFARATAEADLVFSHNTSSMERYRSAWDERCHLFDRSFVTDSILVSDAELAERNRRLVSRNGPLRLVAAGRQVEIKGTDQVLRAMAAAIERGADLAFDIMGEGADRGAFEALAHSLGLDGRVHFHGSIPYGDELFAHWDRAHVFVITNLTAEISRNVLLSMARGLPLISYRNPGTDPMVEQHGAALLVPTGDVDALTEQLLAAHAQPENLAACAERGLALARDRTLEATHRTRAELVRRLFAES